MCPTTCSLGGGFRGSKGSGSWAHGLQFRVQDVLSFKVWFVLLGTLSLGFRASVFLGVKDT